MGFTLPSLSAVTTGSAATSTWATAVKTETDWLTSQDKVASSRPYAILSASTTQTLAAATITAISLDTESPDVGNGHAGSSASYSIPASGLWMFSAIAAFASTTTSNLVVATIVVNSTIVARDTRFGLGAVQQFTVGPGFFPCTAGDAIQLQMYSTAGSTTDVSIVHPTLCCYWLNS